MGSASGPGFCITEGYSDEKKPRHQVLSEVIFRYMPLISPVNEKVFCAFYKAMTYSDIKLDKNLSISNLEHILPYIVSITYSYRHLSKWNMNSVSFSYIHVFFYNKKIIGSQMPLYFSSASST